MKAAWLSLCIGLLLESAVLACPACSVSTPDKSTSQTFWVLSAMGIIPIVAALIVGLWISRVQRHE